MKYAMLSGRFTIGAMIILRDTDNVRVLLQVVYFAATFPYVILLTLMVTGLLQKGAMQGVFYFITPDFKKLLTVEVTDDQDTTTAWFKLNLIYNTRRLTELMSIVYICFEQRIIVHASAINSIS